MFKQGNYEYFQISKETLKEYIIQKGDLLSLEVFTREGFELVDVLEKKGGAAGAMGSGSSYQYLVESDGYVEMPLYGRMFVAGYTVNQLEDIIESKSQELFNDPYAILEVTNRRAFVFKGSVASVVTLNEAPTNLLEVIAKSGGIADELKAFKIKIIRGDLKQPEIINVDLSTIEGLRNAELIVQSNDIIYIEKRFRFATEILSEITPVLSLATSLTTIIVLVNNLSK
ncbi:MAG: polysaccharide biosynthesis/export family protein [Chitinophagales bacterium]